MNIVFKSVLYAMSSRYLSLLIQLSSVMVVARLLSPHEIGIYSISASLFGFLLLIRDFGIGSYLIQKKNLTKEIIASAFAMSLILCWSLALMAYLAKPVLAEFYNLPQMEEIIGLLIINLMIIPFGSITLSLLKREMQFDKTMVIDVGGAIFNTLVTIVSAYYGKSYMSLAYGSLAGTVATVVLALLFRPANLPLLPNFSNLKSVASFGWKISSSNIFTQIQTSSPDLVIGKIQGPAEAVFFNKTVSVFKLFDQLFQNAIRPVYQSYVADKNRNGADLRLPVLRANEIYLILAWSFVAFMQFNAEAIVLILFGGNWLSIVPLIKIMCISHALSSLFVFHPTTLVSLGKASNVMKLSATLAIAQVLVILAYGHFELTYIFAALITIPLVRLIAIRKDLRDLCAITLRDASGILFVPAIAFTAIYLSNYLVQTLWLAELSAYLYFLCSGLISALVLTLVVFTMNNPLKDVLIPAMASILNRLSHKTASPIKGASHPSPHRQYEEKENS